MKTLMTSCGRGGDVVMSMFAARLVARDVGENPDLLVHSQYVPVANALAAIGMPIGKVVGETAYCPARDEAVSGSFVASWSDRFLGKRYPGYDRYVNCCLSTVPSEHIASCMAYAGGLIQELSVVPSMPEAAVKYSVCGKVAAFHFGASDERRAIRIPNRPFGPAWRCICLGTKNDPCETWIDEDRRGAPISETLDAIAASSLVVGSDSMVTHLSGIAGIPTLCLHRSLLTIKLADRGVYVRGRSVPVSPKGILDAAEVREMTWKELLPMQKS